MLERLSYVIVLSVYGYYLAVQEIVIFLIVVLLLSAAEAQFHKSWLPWPQGMILAWNRASRRERLAYELYAYSYGTVVKL